ncbi:kinase-like domain-containing protein [Roridomyces roridus]|uniref:Kinase-like domain-containing protein n=1 Tax=Roridomyces roridus TaxID=1738132 RepID=A0AAD7BRR4_9AGAR|nr:kinase-like domain-containing protein [Roridomyces roridus]
MPGLCDSTSWPRDRPGCHKVEAETSPLVYERSLCQSDSLSEEDIVLEVFGPGRTHKSTVDIISPRPIRYVPTLLGPHTQVYETEPETARLSVTLRPSESESSSGEETFFGSAFLPDDGSFSSSITQFDRFPLLGGDIANLYRGSINHIEGQKIQVAIKLLRLIEDDPVEPGRVRKRLEREARVWGQMKHPNLHPFIGIYDIGAPFPALLSPFCKFGNIQNYLEKYPLANRNMLVQGVASGLKHLHEHGIVHGALKPQNILIDKRGVACISDFGVSTIINPNGFTLENCAYIAPELVVDPFGPRRTTGSDVYAFACLVFEISTAFETPRAVKDKLGGFMSFIAHHDAEIITWAMRSVLVLCWDPEPRQRPTMAAILTTPAFEAI